MTINKTREELVPMVRAFLGDMTQLNRLIPGVEVSEDRLKLALDLALDQYNNTPPFETVTFQTFPSLAIIVHGAAIQALIMAGLVHTRNRLDFNDGGISQVVQNKAPEYQSWIQNMLDGYRTELLNIKISRNMERNFGVIPSPYGNVFDYDC